MAKQQDTSAKAVDGLKLSPHVAEAMRSVQAEILEAYRDRFIEMTEALRQQASALNRIQETLRVLVQHIDPKLVGQLPAAIRVAGVGKSPDLASTLVVADPIGMGFILSQADLAKALGLGGSAVSVLVRAFRLADDEAVAVVVRRGPKHSIVNYHPNAIARVRALVASPPAGLSKQEKATVARAREKLAGRA